MSSNAPVPLATVPLDGRPDIVIRHLLAALLIVPAGALGGWFLASSLGVGSLASVGAAVAATGVLASAIWRWRGRFELHGDHLAHGRGATLDRVSFDEVETVEVRLNEPFKGATPDAYAQLRVGVRGASPVVISNRTLAALAPIVARLSGAIADRAQSRFASGEEVRFVDRAPFPFLLVSVCALAAAFVSFAVLSEARSHRFVSNLPGLIFFAALGSSMLWRAIRSWWSARKSRGVALSAQGLRPLADAELAARASRVGAPFRGSVGEAAGWIPWSAIGAVEHRGYDVVLHLHSRPEPVVLSAATRDLPVLLELVRRQIARAPAPPPAHTDAQPAVTRVRVSSEAPAPAGAESPAPEHHESEREPAQRRAARDE